MDPTVVWAILLFLIGVVIIGVELFVPSGGVLGFLSAAALIGSVVVGFNGGVVLGSSMLASVIVLVPVVIVGFIKLWPHTPIGKSILIPVKETGGKPLDRGLDVLEGRVGMTRTKMLPSGSIEIDGRVYDALSDGIPLEPGELVRVISSRSNRLLVRPATPQEALEAATADFQTPAAPVAAAGAAQPAPASPASPASPESTDELASPAARKQDAGDPSLADNRLFKVARRTRIGRLGLRRGSRLASPQPGE